MIIAVIFALAGLATLNWFVRRSLLYPPAYFAFAWTGFLLLLALSGSMFYPISAPTLLFYFAGAFFFSIGGLCSTAMSDICARIVARKRTYESTQSVRRFTLDLLLVGVIVSIPLYYRWLKHLIGSTDSNFLLAVRSQLLLYVDTEGANRFSLLDNFVTVSVPLTLLMALENDGTKRRKARVWVSAIAALIINIMTGGRAGAITLLLTLVGLSWLRHGKVSWKMIGAIGAMFVVVFSLIAVALEKGNTKRDASVAENLPTIVEGFQWYAVGGLVGFDRVFQQPTVIPATWDIAMPIERAANKLGFRFQTKPLHAEYVPIGPGKVYNVYTMYFAYIPVLGVAGTLALMVVLGFIITKVYLWAVEGIPEAKMMFLLCFAGLTLGGFNESLLMALNPFLKALVLTVILYRWDVLRKLVPSQHAELPSEAP